MIEIIYADSDIVAINKPPGVPVHGGPSVSGPTVADFLLEKFPEIAGVGEDPLRPGIVHRLDRDTSGVMVVARTQESFLALKRLFHARAVAKKYRAIVCGAMRKRAGIIDLPLGRMVGNPVKRAVARGSTRISGAREALTEYRALKTGDGYSLVELLPRTGRMHQLRVHMASIGHPIACDRKYGGKNVCCPAHCGRQLLHAKSLAFSFPEGRRLSFEADEPEDFLLALRTLF